MEKDEAGTLTALIARRRDTLKPLVPQHHGRIVKLIGDGLLVEFASAANSVNCAIQLEESMSATNAEMPKDRLIVLRLGINLGDAMVDAPISTATIRHVGSRSNALL